MQISSENYKIQSFLSYFKIFSSHNKIITVKMSNKIKFAYWGGRGRGHVCRLLLVYTGANWENIAYTDKNQWFANQKSSIGLDFPNLPYLIDGEYKLTQSKAIQRYIIKKAGNNRLLGFNLKDSAKVSEILGVLADVQGLLYELLFDKDFQSKLKQKWDKLKPKIDCIEKFVGTKDYVIGYLTLPDFHISELANYIEKFYPEEFKKCGAFQRIGANVNNLQQIKKYYGQQNAIK